MAPKKILNAENLESLGARRLAELLIEISEDDAATKRRLKLELTAHVAPEKLAAEVRKRLVQIGHTRSFADWRKVREVAADLDTQRGVIIDQVAKTDPAEALELMWRVLGLAPSVYDRCDDSNGEISDVFGLACHDLGFLAEAAKPDPIDLADLAFVALTENGYGQYDDLIRILSPSLGTNGLNHLKNRFLELSKKSVKRPAANERKVIGWGTDGPLYADEIEADSRDRTTRFALQEIADAQGDVDFFVAQYDEDTKKVPRVAAEIARRLLAAGRAGQALEMLNAAVHSRKGWPEFDWEDTRIDVLEALGQRDDAQAARWSCFERALSGYHLRAYLKRLPDFDDAEAEVRALDIAERHPEPHQALMFLVGWPALDRAARLVRARAADFNGDHYELLAPAADALAAKYPLAATIVLRSMIIFTLTKARSSRYRHAARHLMECESLASVIDDFGGVETHATFVARLKVKHGRKSGFWKLVA